MNIRCFYWPMKTNPLRINYIDFPLTLISFILFNLLILMVTAVRTSDGYGRYLGPSYAASEPSSKPIASPSSALSSSSPFFVSQRCPEGPPSQWESQLDAASKAYLAPIVFNGKLISLSEDYGGKIAATFRVRKEMKNSGSVAGTVPVHLVSGSLVTLYFVRAKRARSQSPYCAVYLNDTVISQLRPDQRYIVFASSPLLSLIHLQRKQITSSDCVNSDLPNSKVSNSLTATAQTSHPLSSSPSSPSLSLCINYLSAFASPELHNKHSARAVRKILNAPQGAQAPQVRGLSGDLRIQSKAKLRLKCKVSGNPTPWIEWFRNGKRLKSKGRISIKNVRRDKSLLEIKLVQTTDTGYYECRAMNVVAREPSIGRTRVIVSPYPIARNASSTERPSKEATTTSTTTTSSPSTAWHAKGRPCPIATFCLNGGTCSFYENVGEHVCVCAEGYIGLRCDFKDVRRTTS